MQRAAHEPPAKDRIDGVYAKGQRARAVLNPGYPLQVWKALTKLLDQI